MKPDEINNNSIKTNSSPQVTIEDIANQPNKDSTADIIRSQINNIYESGNTQVPKSVPIEKVNQLEDINPYQRTHEEHVPPQDDQWKKYHTAWQNYYQKYYEGYYSYHLNKHISKIEESKPVVLSKEDEMFKLRQKLLGKVINSASNVKKSRHFIPILSGLAVALVFIFLQYNSFIASNVMAYVSPGNIDPQNIIINPNTDIVVSPESRLIIPKINVDVPVMYGIGNDYDSQMAAMAVGLAHFAIPGASSYPGQIGNTVISGHSSNDLLEVGDYKFIFVQLDKLNVGDIIYANYNSKRYTYTVTKKEIVKPKDVNRLVYETTKPILTLITCTPLGTSTNRLLVTAEQISPDPSKSIAAPITTTETDTALIPGSTPTFLERLFGKK